MLVVDVVYVPPRRLLGLVVDVYVPCKRLLGLVVGVVYVPPSCRCHIYTVQELTTAGCRRCLCTCRTL